MPPKKRLLLIGGSGYLGQHLAPLAAPSYDLYATYQQSSAAITAGQALPLDLTNRNAVVALIQELAPEIIIHTAAINPGRGNDLAMQRVNVDGSRYMAEAANLVGARLVHVSSDVVHDGRHAPYADDAPPNPLNVYGQTKALGEAAVQAYCPHAAIVRTSLIYGLNVIDRSTAGFAAQLQRGETLALFSDVIRQPVWVEDLATALLKLGDLDFAGLLNIAGSQPITRELFGRKLLQWWQVGHETQICAGLAAEISDTIPLDLRLTLDKAEALLNMNLKGVDEVIKRSPNL